MKNHWIEITGWVGASMILLAYLLGSFLIIENTHLSYQLLNFFGATGVAIISFKKKAYQPLILNIIWGVIALFALLKIVF